MSLTESHRATAPDLPWAATIPNAIALDDHPCRAHRGGEYLFWLGRMSADKGPVTAIEVARAAGMPLVLAGKLRAAEERRYFAEQVQPRLGGGIAYVGEIDLHERVRLLHGALALINPLAWDEPFGLVMVEAMACGVPVIATPRGSVPEIVIPGQTGWIARDGGRDGRGRGALRRDRPERVPRDRRARLLARADGGRLRGGLRRRRRGRPQRLSADPAHDCLDASRTSARVSPRRAGRTGPSNAPEKGSSMLALLLILLLLALLFGGFFVFSLKVAIVVAIVLLLVGPFGGYSYRGRRTA